MSIYDDYKFEKYIQGGRYGKILVATHKISDIKVAIKILLVNKCVSELDIRNEIKTLNDLTFSNYILRYFTHYDNITNNDHYFYIVTEYINGDNLYDYMNNLDSILTPVNLWYLFKQLIEGCRYIHSMKYAHRDIKPENIMISNNKIKYIDFGLSCSNIYNTGVGTTLYMPPEFFSNMSEKSLYACQAHDVWSLSLILYQLCVRDPEKFPFSINNDYGELLDIDDIKYNISKAPNNNINYDLDNGKTNDFMSKILINNWNLRPTAFNIHTIFMLDIYLPHIEILRNTYFND